MAWNKIGNLAALSLGLIFTACGGDSGNNGRTDTDVSVQAETFDDLPNCSKNREGEIYEVIDNLKTYQCVDGRWEEYVSVPDSVKTEDDLPVCLEKLEGKIAIVSKDKTAWGCFDSRWEEIGKAYERADDLPNCSEKRDGSVSYIMDEGKQLFCFDGKWTSEKADPPDQGGESKSEVKSSSSNKTSSSSVTKKETAKSSSSETKNTSSEKSSSSVQNTPSSSSIQSSDSAEPNVSYGTLTDERDGQKYKTVKIGEQIWMAENLNYDYKIDGKRYGSYCYDDEPDSCTIYGRLYTWAAAMDSAALFSDDGKVCGDDTLCVVSNVQGVCPENWHLPSFSEWSLLLSEIGNVDPVVIGKGIDASLFKADSKWRNNGLGINAYGFSALPAGCRDCGWGNNLIYSGEGGITYFWTASESMGNSSSYILMKDSVYIYDSKKSIGYSVRCVKNIYREKMTKNIEVRDRENFEIPFNTVLHASMPKCGSVGQGLINCQTKSGTICSIVDFGDLKINTCESVLTNILKDSVTNYCGRNITISSTENTICNVYFY